MCSCNLSQFEVVEVASHYLSPVLLMSESYRAILIDGHLRWIDDVPAVIRQGTVEVRVRVTIEERDDHNEDELASLLDELAAQDPFQGVEDPAEWQRRLRREGDVGRE